MIDVPKAAHSNDTDDKNLHNRDVASDVAIEGADGEDDPVETGKESTCTGYIRRVENDEFTIRAVLCNNKVKTFKFKHLVVDTKPNPQYPYIAVYTSSLYDQVPEAGADDVYPDELFIVNVRNNRKYHYKFAASPSCHYDLWSPEGTYAAFKRENIDIVQSTDLDKYMQRYDDPYRVVSTNKNPSELSPAHLMDVVRWRTETILVVTGGCCGDVWTTEYNLATDTYRRLECAYGNCMRIRFDNLEALQSEVVITGGMLTKYEMHRRLYRYLESVNQKCFKMGGEELQNDAAGEFTLTFDLRKDGKVALPIITTMKINEPPGNETSLRNCLTETAEEISFSGAECSGTEHISIRITILGV